MWRRPQLPHSTEPLALLLLPSRLEQFELERHARDLLAIPRVAALEPPRVRTSGVLADAVAAKSAKRLKLPGRPRVLVLYHPLQYPLARAIIGRFNEAELWYFRPSPQTLLDAPEADALPELDERARARAVMTLSLTPSGDVRAENEPLRRRMLELGVISVRPFVPGARIRRE